MQSFNSYGKDPDPDLRRQVRNGEKRLAACGCWEKCCQLTQVFCSLDIQTPKLRRYLDPQNIPIKDQTSGGMTGCLGFVAAEVFVCLGLKGDQLVGGINAQMLG